MDAAYEGGLSIEFAAGALSPAPPRELRPNSVIGWFVQSVDVNSASTRYRCFHFARALKPRFDSLYLASSTEVQEALPRLDALIIVKRLDRAVLDVIGMARQYGVPVFLDLCDDLISPAYFKNDFGVNLLHLVGIAPFLSGVTVSSAEMADRIEAYIAENGGARVPVHVVPDVAETWEIFRATHKSVTGRDPPGKVEVPLYAGTARPKQVLWFGNFGASHSNFGMFTLRPHLKSLEAVHCDIPLELVVVSNSESVFQALVHNRKFGSRYIPWTPTAIYSALAEADVALLTTGDDEFCSIKSSNRVLQALAAGVPVMTTKCAAVAEFEAAIFSARVEDSLRLCLGRRGQDAVRVRLAAAQAPLARYTPESLSAIWAGLLSRAIEARRATPRDKAGRPVLFLIEPADRPASVKAALLAAKSVPGLEFELLVAIDAVEKTPALRPLLHLPRRLPRFFAGKLKGVRNLMLECSAIVVDRRSGPVAKELAANAERLGVRVLTTDDAAADGALRRFARKRAPSIRPNTILAGPYPERTDADGSVEWAFIVHQNARGWILDAICREIGSRQPASWKVFYHPEVSGEARNLFFSHYMLLENYLERRPEKIEAARIFVWYTHPREESAQSIARQLLAFEQVTKVIFACESNRQIWLARGLAEEKTAVVLGAADPNRFRFHERGNGCIGLSSSFYERKNPDCLLQLVKLLPHRKFVLLGRNWNQYARFEELLGEGNFTYLTAPYREYPDIYATFDVFLSMSSLEGGPIPLIEAMMSNAVPVASRTGFAPDLIRYGENGFIFDLDAPPQAIARMIEAAFALDTDVRSGVQQYDWEHFSAAVVKLAE